MNYNNDNNSEMWDWQQDQDCDLEDNASTVVSKSLLNGLGENEQHLSCSFDDATTPLKACGDLAYHVTNEVVEKEFDQQREHSAQVKRRRMLQFESEVLDSSLLSDETFLRSEETKDSLEDVISDMSEWVAGFAECPSGSSSEYLDTPSEGWIADCFNDSEMQFSTAEDISGASGASKVQVEITELCNTPPEYEANAVQKPPVHTPGNIILRGRKSLMRTPPKIASSVVYPFTFIKPCGVHGDVTLKDINQRIHNPPKSKQNEQEDPCVAFPTSAFSGKPVVGKTKIRTEGGEGSITILRTKG